MRGGFWGGWTFIIHYFLAFHKINPYFITIIQDILEEERGDNGNHQKIAW
jgi:hypothetical protein